MKAVRLVKNQSGFSLIELMIVVAIIGILASIAVPNFQKFQMRAKQSESKTYLGALYTAEKSFIAEWDSYSTCMEKIGFDRDGQNPRYVAGFTAAFPGPGPACVAFFRGAAPAPGAYTATAAVFDAAASAAAGQLGPSQTIADAWSINHNRAITLRSSGL